MRIAFINPHFQRKIRRIAQTSVGPPLGLAYLASAAREAGHEAIVVEANAEGLDDADVVSRVLAFDPDVIGITATTPTIRQAGRIADAIKASKPDKIVIVGGPHTTALPKRSLEELLNVDIVAQGESERTFPLLLFTIASSGLEAAASVPGFAVRTRDGSIVTSEAVPFEEDLDALPLPARDLLPMHLYRTVDSNAFTTMLAMRGCPCKCVYCAVPLIAGRRLRHRSPEAVTAEMREVHDRFGVDFVSFVDDTFTWDRDWVFAFNELVRKQGLHRRLRWQCLTRADRVDHVLLRDMKAAGCIRIEMGIESGSKKGLSYLKKGISPEAVIEGFRAARAAGLSTMGFAILNIPGETREDIEETFKVVLEADPDFLQVSFLTPLPGTALWEQALSQGTLLTEDFERYRFLKEVVLKNDLLSEDELQRCYLSFIRRFYLRPRTALKLMRLVISGRTRFMPLARTALHAVAAALGWRVR